jgi:hypothetical protein
VPGSGEGDGEAPLGEADARRLVLRALAALIAFVLAGGIAVLLSTADEGSQVPYEGEPTADGEPLFTGEAPLPGTDVPSYAVQRKATLARVEGRAVAVVSFDRYRTESDARTLLEGVPVRALLVAPPGGEPAAVVGSLARWAEEARVLAQSERSGLERMAAETEDPAFVAQFKADIDRLTSLLQRLDPRGALVFGAVVEADAEVLRTVGGKGGVRLVDPVDRGWPGNAEAKRYGGFRPEETARAGDPPTRPL